MILTRYSAIVVCLLLGHAQPAFAQDSLTDSNAADPDTMSVPVAEDDLEAEVAVDPDTMSVPVAEDDLEAEVAADLPLMTDEELLQAEFERFKELLGSGALDEADASAKRIIELAIGTSGPQSAEMARALTNLAIVQQQAGELDAAQQNYEAAIEIIEDTEDRLNAALVNPLTGLAAAQLQSGRPDLAARTYERAVHVTHVNEGPHNLEQVDLLESLAEVQLRMGDREAARDIQETIFALNARRYEVDSMEMVPPLMRRARWQHRAGFVYDERASYRRIIRIIEEQVGQDALELVEPLILLGQSFFSMDTSGAAYQATTMATGEIYFKRALRIAAESPDSNWNVIADATLALGDYYQQSGDTQRAQGVYRNAWDLLSERDPTGVKLERRHATLESVILLSQGLLPESVGDAQPSGVQELDDPVQQGTITLGYAISPRGRVVDLRLIEHEPDAFTDLQSVLLREVRRSIFRPRFEDGSPVATENQVLVHRYYYRQSDLDAARTVAAEASTDESS